MNSTTGHDRGSLCWLAHGVNAAAAAVTVLILAVGCGVAYGLASQRDHLIALEQQAADCLNREDEIRSNHQHLIQRLAATTAATEKLLSYLPGDPQEARFIAQVAELAEDNRVQITAFRPGGSAPQGALDQLELRLSCESSYGDFCTFLRGLQEIPRLCHVTSMDVARLDPDGAVLRVELQLQLLFARPKTPPAASSEIKA